MDSFGSRIEYAMEKRGVKNRAELAKRLQRTQSTVKNWCERDKPPGGRAVADIAKALGVNAEWLKTGDGPMETPTAAGIETGKRIQEARGDCLISQGDVAAYLDIPIERVAAWEAGEEIPRGDERRRLADCLGVHTEWLRSGRGPRAIPSGAEFDPVSDEEAKLAGRTIENAVAWASLFCRLFGVEGEETRTYISLRALQLMSITRVERVQDLTKHQLQEFANELLGRVFNRRDDGSPD